METNSLIASDETPALITPDAVLNQLLSNPDDLQSEKNRDLVHRFCLQELNADDDYFQTYSFDPANKEGVKLHIDLTSFPLTDNANDFYLLKVYEDYNCVDSCRRFRQFLINCMSDSAFIDMIRDDYERENPQWNTFEENGVIHLKYSNDRTNVIGRVFGDQLAIVTGHIEYSFVPGDVEVENYRSNDIAYKLDFDRMLPNGDAQFDLYYKFSVNKEWVQYYPFYEGEDVTIVETEQKVSYTFSEDEGNYQLVESDQYNSEIQNFFRSLPGVWSGLDSNLDREFAEVFRTDLEKMSNIGSPAQQYYARRFLEMLP